MNAGHENKIATVHTDFLPLLQCVWITENSVVAAGMKKARAYILDAMTAAI